MSEFKETKLILDKKFDTQRKRHYLNGNLVVLHCHHYSALYTQLALDAEETELLQHVSEEAFFSIMKKYFEENEISDTNERIELGAQYYSAIGLGKMNVKFLGDESGEVELTNSHLDSGWLKKWGEFDKPVNFISAGYISGLFSAVQDKPVGTFDTIEIQSIVKGDPVSLFKVYKS